MDNMNMNTQPTNPLRETPRYEENGWTTVLKIGGFIVATVIVKYLADTLIYKMEAAIGERVSSKLFNPKKFGLGHNQPTQTTQPSYLNNPPNYSNQGPLFRNSPNDVWKENPFK
jgi:hypothetical protein